MAESLSTILLAEEAEKRGIKVTPLLKNISSPFLKLEFSGEEKYIFGQKLGNTPHQSIVICRHKELTKKSLASAGINTPVGEMFNPHQEKEAAAFGKKTGFPLVVKPVYGTWGKNVHVGIKNEADLGSVVAEVAKHGSDFLIEEQVPGKEYRVLATKEKLIGIINRIPANITGDGQKTVKELVNEKNSDPRRGDAHEKALVKIVLDAEAEKCLKEQDLNLNSAPKIDQFVFLRKNSNLSTGGDSIDVTDKAHPNYQKLGPRVIRAIPGLPYAGFDLLVEDITADPFKDGYAIIEINESPMISMHHFPYEGVPRNAAKDVIDLLFPETKVS